MMFYKEAEFQETPIGRIPKDWETTRLSELSEHITKGTTPTTYGFGYTTSGIHFIKVESIDERGAFIPENIPHISEEANETFSRSILRENDILFSIAGALGRVATVTDEILPANTNQALAIVRLKEQSRLSVEYLKHFLMGSQIQNFVRTIAIQSQQANINLEHVRNFTVALPSVKEQEGIVGALGAVDSAILKVDEVIAKTERLKKGLMQELLTKGIGHKEYEDTPIGKTPKTWQIVRLKEKAWVKEGIYGKRSEAGNIIQLKADSIQDVGRINAEAYARISVNRDVDNFLLKLDDILLSNRNSADLVGKSAIFRGEFGYCVPSNLLTRIRIYSKDMLPEWLLYVLMKMQQANIFKALSTRAVNQVLLKKESVEKINVPLPPLSEQRKIVSILLAVDKKVAYEKSEKAKLERIRQGLMDLLLTGKVRVKVD